LFSLVSLLALQPGAPWPWTKKFAVSACSLAFYLYKTIAPFNLAPLYERRASDEAIALYRRSIVTHDSYVYSHNNLGYELVQGGDVDGAMAEYRKAFAINPMFAEANVNLRNALLARRELDQAVAQYAGAGRLEPHRAGIRFNWAWRLANRAI
jgi:tetratricopeptide (TPR) repeat protein